MNKLLVVAISLFLLTSYVASEAKTLETVMQGSPGVNQAVNIVKGEGDALAGTSDSLDANTVLAMNKPSPVIAVLKNGTKVYQHYDNMQETGYLPQGSQVEILKDRAYKWYKVKSSAGISGWIPAETLSIPSDPATIEQKMTKEQAQAFVNLKGFASDTPYMVWVDIARQQTHIFTGKKGDWRLAKTFDCSTGKNISPTLRGKFTIKDRGTWFYSPEFKSGAKYWVQYNNTYLFHSIAMDSNQTVTDSTIGKRASAGCIRLAENDAEWFFNYVSKGSFIFID